jgi:hypothetical protein
MLIQHLTTCVKLGQKEERLMCDRLVGVYMKRIGFLAISSPYSVIDLLRCCMLTRNRCCKRFRRKRNLEIFVNAEYGL